MASIIPPGVVLENEALKAAPRWRREPFIVFFPLGVALSWAGVGHWLAHALGWIEDYQPIFHAMAQVQGFLMCFAVGFLFTMIPRRTGTAPPAAWQMVVGMLAPVATATAAWNQYWMTSQLGWLALCAVLISFVAGRFRSARSARRPPNSFVWIPLALLMGLSGSLMTGAYGALGDDYLWLHDIGRGMLLQGTFVALVLGVGGLAFPLMTRGVPPADPTGSAADVRARAGHLVAAGVLIASFAVQAFGSLPVAMLLRAGVVLAVYVTAIELWRLPSAAGWNRRLVWLAGWMVPAGFLLAAALPDTYKAGLHVTFIGGFAMLALAVSTHVTLGHGGFGEELSGRPWQVAAIGAFLVAAVVARVAMDLDRNHFFHWMGVAAAFFLAATAVWACFLVPKMLRPRGS